MPKLVRSARGEIVDFELLAIKAQLASAPVPKPVEERKIAIDEKDGVKPRVAADLDMLEIAKSAAEESAGQAKNIKKK